MNKPFEFNERWRFVPAWKYDTDAGQILWRGSRPPARAGYKTITHMFMHNFSVLENTPHNVSLSTRRVTCRRVLDEPGVDQVLLDNQLRTLEIRRGRASLWFKTWKRFANHVRTNTRLAMRDLNDHLLGLVQS